MRKILKIIGIIVLILIVGISILLKFLGSRPVTHKTRKLEVPSKPNIWQLVAMKYLLMKSLYCKVFQNIPLIIRPSSKQQMKNILS